MALTYQTPEVFSCSMNRTTYRKLLGAFIVVPFGTPVSDTLVEIAIRPSPSHVIADNWQSDPMNPLVCWRLKTSQELDAEETATASEALKLVASCILEAVFDMKQNPANYPTAASLKQKALELYKAKL